MNPPKNLSGHFSAIFTEGAIMATTITSRRKSRAREIEAARRDELCKEIEAITGKPAKRIARSIDGVNRRWNGVKGNASGSE
jgi:hypothetical protein